MLAPSHKLFRVDLDTIILHAPALMSSTEVTRTH
jgi:hypothetical protein